MGKEYTLPWTCKQAEKFWRVFHWIICITAPISLVYSLYLQITNQINLDAVLSIFYGGFGTLFGWLWMILILDSENKLPHFRCKLQKEMSG